MNLGGTGTVQPSVNGGYSVRTPIALAVLVVAFSTGCNTTPKEPVERARKAVELYKEGVAEFNEGKIDAGIASLKKANEIQPGYTLLRYDLGRMLLVRAERTDADSMRGAEAAKQLRQSGKHDEARQKEDEAENLRRQALVDLREAQQHFLWAAESWPHNANVPYFLSIVYTGLGDFATARSYLQRAIDLGQPTGAQREKLDRALEILEQAEIHQKRLSEK